MVLRIALFVLWLTTNSLSASLHKSRHDPKYSRASRKRQSSFLPSFNRDTALAAQAATRQKFRNAPALLVGYGISPGFTIPSSLQNAYDRASDYVTNISLLSSRLMTPANSRFTSSPAIRVASAGTPGGANNVTSIPLSDDTDNTDDFEYYGPLLFGSQGQPVGIDFDTGSADLWIPVDCDCGNIKSFEANKSTTYRNTGQSFQVTYGSGHVSGKLAQDTVTVGSHEVSNQYFGAVEAVSQNFANAPNDGLAGLAFSTIANSQKPTLFENLVSQSQLVAPLFSFYMTRTKPRGSEVCFGGVDQTRVKGGNISWVQVVSKTYWTVKMTGVLVNSLIPTDVSAIIDTGTSFIYIPDDIVTAIYDQITGSGPAPDYGDGFYYYPCNTRARVSFVLGTTTLALDPRDMSIGQYSGSNGACVGAIIGAGATLGTSAIAILGDSFLKSYVSVFDYSHGARVGFLESINE